MKIESINPAKEGIQEILLTLNSSMETQSALYDVCKHLLVKEPFFGQLLARTHKVFSEETERLDIDLLEGPQYSIRINPHYWTHELRAADRNQTLKLRIGALKHQILHLLFQHPWLRPKYPDPVLFDIAADALVNQFIHPEQLGRHYISPSLFSKTTSTSTASLDDYYHILLELDSAIIDKIQQAHHLALAEHAHWRHLQQVPVSEQRQLIRQQEQLQGRLLKEVPLAEQLDRSFLFQHLNQQHDPGIDWRRFLRGFIAKSHRTYLQHSKSRPSKRYGTTPGIRLQKGRKILLAIDTSGSISAAILQSFFQQVDLIGQSKVAIEIIECDYRLRANYTYRRQAISIVKGGGATDFNPPIQIANARYDADALIYFTDGYGAVPQLKSRLPLLWVISPEGIEENSLEWGRFPGWKVKMKAAFKK